MLRTPARFARKDFVFARLVEKRDDGSGRFRGYEPSGGLERVR